LVGDNSQSWQEGLHNDLALKRALSHPTHGPGKAIADALGLEVGDIAEFGPSSA